MAPCELKKYFPNSSKLGVGQESQPERKFQHGMLQGIHKWGIVGDPQVHNPNALDALDALCIGFPDAWTPTGIDHLSVTTFQIVQAASSSSDQLDAVQCQVHAQNVARTPGNAWAFSSLRCTIGSC